MNYDKSTILEQIKSAFPGMDGETREACIALLDARAKSLGYSFEEYTRRYHPAGIAYKDDSLPPEYEGYTQFIAADARAIIGAGRGADFFTFVHECAHVFRRQLSGELLTLAEKAFGVQDGVWTAEHEDTFANGLEQWIKYQNEQDNAKKEIYIEGELFVDSVYRDVERIIDITPEMSAVYEKLFNANQNEFDETLLKDNERREADARLTRLYKRRHRDAGRDAGQGELDFGGGTPLKTPERDTKQPGSLPEDTANTLNLIKIPLSNTPENYLRNFAAIADEFTTDKIEAARYLLRMMPKDARAQTIAELRAKGCDTPQSFHAFFNDVLNKDKALTQEPPPGQTQFQTYAPFGAWTDYAKNLSPAERSSINAECIEILDKSKISELTPLDKSILKRYSGFGGIKEKDERGVLYDFYTSPPVADLTWQLLDKAAGGIYKGARVLEPSCGAGVFFETAPKNNFIDFTGVELDARTAGIAKLLHEDVSENGIRAGMRQLLHNNNSTEIINSSFEAFNISNKAGNFDFVIGNAPFGERSLDTARLDMPDERGLDNYFVSRSIDNLKKDGVMALITAPGVLKNKSNENFRLDINKKAQFIGAVKLPNKSFKHSNTQVTPDILLFRKYPEDIGLVL